MTHLAVMCLLVAAAAGRPEGPFLRSGADGAADRQGAGAPAEVIAAIQVHGNHLTPDDEIVRLAGLSVGEPFGPATLDEAARRLRRAGRFDTIDLRKRFASLADPSRIAVVIIVAEGPVRIELPDDPTLDVRVVRRTGLTNLMFMPLFSAEDGYGASYGVRMAFVGAGGRRGRVSVPVTWGGHRRVAVEFDRPFARGPVSRIEAGAAIQQVRNPAFDVEDLRRRVWARAERAIGPLRLGGGAEWQRVSFAGEDEDVRLGGVDATLDTRRDPMLPRNAVLAALSWSRLARRSRPAIDRTRLDLRGYLPLVGQSVLVVRALREDASRPLPPAFQSILGGSRNLRGFRAGEAAGDTLAAGSVEVRVPLSSPLSVGRFGVSAFVDAAAAYAEGQRFRDQRFRTGIGGGVWLTATAFRVSVSVARGREATTRVHVEAGLAF